MSRQLISLKKRGEIWHYSYTSPTGDRVRRSSRTTDKNLATQLASKEYNECWRVFKLGERPEYYWQEAVVQWLEEKPKRKQDRNMIYGLRWLDRYLGNKKLNEIDRNLIKFIQTEKAKEGVKNRTINAILQQIRVILRAAVEWDWLDKCPAIKLLPEPKRRIRWLTESEEMRLMQELPEHLKAIVQFAILTGLRMSNITQLKWSQIDLPKKLAWVNSDESKTGNSIGIPLNDKAIEVIITQFGKHKENVFTYKGKPVRIANTKAFRNALSRAGIKDFRFHDLRHTWATRHIMSGTPLYVLQELGGWSKTDTVRKYAHLSVEHLHSHVNNVQLFGTKLAQH
ncbi:tyrosine-type recombinase/integrase [Avibacterium sp. 21-599]|uniref:tyrosine-type recombinase/integrase n=1 Tax=Avibacterium sp. 21-599 TaxID=2911528 RepID=UPI0022462585|nr:site-specific integrase [Avibacterium sp. 21-599]MCW9717389.1 tyrosine-type recombinase/integrase [Avibacterium sp. 21-599]